jgi:DNA-binding beta-propeller fold protein YncE
MKIIKRYQTVLTTLFIVFIFIQLHGQTVIWLESDFGSPRLVKTDAGGVELESLKLAPGSLPQAMAVDERKSTYYTAGLSFLNGTISYADPDLSNLNTVIEAQSALRGIALDTLNNQIYWTSTNLVNGPNIMRSSMNGESPEVLLDFGKGSSNTPRAICLDPENKKMYWTNFGQGKIQRSDMAQNAIPEDIVTGLNGPSGLAIDSESGKIFWTELNGYQIKSADLNGENVAVILSEVPYPNYIAVNATLGRIAWTELGTGKVKSANLDGTKIFDYNVHTAAPSGIVIEDSPVSALEAAGLNHSPIKFSLTQNYPNPFNPETTIKYSIPEANEVTLQIYNINGQLVNTIVNKYQEKGEYAVTWKPVSVSSGIYFFRLNSGKYSEVKKLIFKK